MQGNLQCLIKAMNTFDQQKIYAVGPYIGRTSNEKCHLKSDEDDGNV